MQRTPFGGSPPPGGLPRFDLVAAVILAVVVVGLLPSYGGQSPAHTAAPGAGPGASLTANALAMAHPHGVRGSLKWTQLAPGASPSGRSAFMMAYDPVDHEVVLFGGTPRFLGDTWTFANGNWTQLTPATSPPARYGGTMSFDAKDGYVLLFGGLGARGALNDTWSFRGGIWTNLTHPRAPSPRFGASMAYDPPIGRVVLFGGCGFLPPFQTLCPSNGGLFDTWTYRGGNWTELPANRTHPHARYLAGLAYDARDKVLELYGGNGASAFLSSTWELIGQRWHLIAKTSVAGTRGDFGMVYTPHGAGAVILFGGMTGEFPSTLDLGGTYQSLNGSWSLVPISGPTARQGTAMADDIAAHAVILFGGYVGTSATYSNQTWELH